MTFELVCWSEGWLQEVDMIRKNSGWDQKEKGMGRSNFENQNPDKQNINLAQLQWE